MVMDFFLCIVGCFAATTGNDGAATTGNAFGGGGGSLMTNL